MVSFILCLLPALLATTSAQGETLTCDTCFGQTETCSFAAGTCQDNKATGGCLSVAEDITLDGTRTPFFYKECLSNYKSDIKVPISFTVGNGKYFRINTTQCNDTDNCNSAILGVPTGNTTKNGLQCPTCFALNFTVCNNSVTPCTGDETYCMDFTGYLVNDSAISTIVGKGCATASTKEIKPETTLISAAYRYVFLWGTSVPAEKIPINPPSTTATPANTTPTPTPSPINITLPKTTPSGASPEKFSFALYLPGLTGLLLVKLLS
ncbi:phospholipase A2 inhibitor and Ly6/PLAUR domain-containing protein-like [Terrapene carolina triunguis]|uniref:phospholipase A2 inhibitor and Ly6/PLAUR domain-containing protein-like n=1 Tax=Terrapene triunguis TaxID=2587831 RepID=UPI000E774C8C|nr:phospholipase A2 inhibitor and Ly6/PLAUR domain-containing protein-like [Terrapene carolina triunguis]